MKVAMYARISKHDQSQDPENQLIRLRAYAADRGWEVYGEFVDKASGADSKRPALGRMLADARARRFGIILVTKVDRLARSLLNLETIMKELDGRGVKLECVDQPISTVGPSGTLMRQILGSVAEFERELIRERTIDGLRKARSEGKRLGRPPMDVSTEEIVRLKAEGLTHRQVASRVGMSYQGVRKRLRSAGATKRGGSRR
ncbi:MAG: recombinase family protein [Candidatus Thermoplasmatota archaeon]|nr:recombinase family protein [Candidatus Thermoplasmatota archaeon]